jgi:membrane protease YdiL (CAAX protease family)
LKKDSERSLTKVQHALLFTTILMVVMAVFALACIILYQLAYVSYDQFYFMANAGIELAFLVSAFLYLRFTARGTASALGLGRKGISQKNVALGLLVFMAILVLELIVSLISQVTGVPISTNVSAVFAGAPLWFLFFSVVVAPVCEEVLFRGLMVPRIGIVVSALLFAAMHAGYDSTFAVEVLAALVFGLIAGYVFKKTESLYPSMLAHVLVNATAVLLTF